MVICLLPKCRKMKSAMVDKSKKTNSFEELFKIKAPPGLDYHFQKAKSEIHDRIEEIRNKINTSPIFQQGKLKVGEVGKAEALPIPDFDQLCLELAVEIFLDSERQDPEKEKKRIEKEYLDLEKSLLQFCVSLFYLQGHLIHKTTVANQKKKNRKFIELLEGITELKQWALDQLSDSPKGKSKPDLRDSLAQVFQKHIPGVNSPTIDSRLMQLSQELKLNFPSGPDAIRKRIERRPKKHTGQKPRK